MLASGIHDPLEREADHKSCGLHAQLENKPLPIDRLVKIFVEAHGCTQNYGEARLMTEALAGVGHRIVASERDADAHVLVTCTVVETTERKMIRRMTELAAYEKPLVVAGCMATAQRQRVLDAVPRARLLPARKWPQIVELLGAETVCGDRSAEIESQSFGWHDAIVPIAQGCAGRCTYCITRVARGRVSSYPIEGIVAQVRKRVDQGAREIKLTGQDTAAYGLDAGTDLPALLRAFDQIPGEFRVRVGMADPLTVYPIRHDLVDAYRSERIFKFLHLPVQSGDDEILEAMRRDYSVAEFEDIVRAFRIAFPRMTLSTDVIVGFPGETEGQFDRTIELIRRTRPDIVNVTRFSARTGTPAASLPNGIGIVGWRVKERSRRLTRLRFEIARDVHRTFVGEEVDVLVTEPGKGTTVLARTPEYRQVVLQGPLPLGEFVRVRIEEARATDLRGRCVGEPTARSLRPSPPDGPAPSEQS
jgi:MiaB-like tRNA modifying enzyme